MATLAFICLLLLAGTHAPRNRHLADGAHRRIHITDDLEDVVDDEEDDSWREWGVKKTSPPEFDPPPMDLIGDMDPSRMQEEMMKRQIGPVFGFAKLRLGSRRTPEMVTEIAMKWSKLARTGAIEAKFMGFDVSTIMFTMEKGQDTLELKEFLLSQPEAYEIKMGDQLFRRPGDPPFEEVFEKFQREKDKKESTKVKPDEMHQEL
ncbi:unnamed protein product [Cuscuta campestris]|uniref:Mesoderm development candidate 2 n=1 Tax=Cuscuta campestris TaxID=132261 RepID=A0A484LK18_9ASTE|nr:unnamed protein product [Cuscuta campestris]